MKNPIKQMGLTLAAAVVMAAGMNCAGASQQQPTAQSGGGGTTAQAAQQSPTPSQSDDGVAAAQAEKRDLPKIAVYVTGNVGADEKEALGTRMLASLVNSGRYIAIERSNSFLAEIEKEHVKQRSGDIDDSQISALGKQFGVKFVCVAAITPAFGDFQISARIVDVETAVVVFIGESSGQLKSMDDLSRVSDNVVENMFGVKTSKARTTAAAASQQKTASGTTFTDSRDGKIYRTVKIGSQTWMAENLNYDVGGSTCYENDPANCEKYGRLYYKSTAMSACPAGFHLPSEAEWNYLEMVVGGSKTAGLKLKSTSSWGSYNGVSGNGTDEYGFSVLSGGIGVRGDVFLYRGMMSVWWSTTGTRVIWYHTGGVSRNTLSGKTNQNSVRCVQD